jgi:hypothetical protein
MVTEDAQHALSGGFRYRHGTQSAAPRPARHCPIGLERRGILFVKAVHRTASRHLLLGQLLPYETRAHKDSLQCFAETWTPGEGIGDLQGQSPPGFLQPSSALVMDMVQWRFPVCSYIKGQCRLQKLDAVDEFVFVPVDCESKRSNISISLSSPSSLPPASLAAILSNYDPLISPGHSQTP